MRSSPSSKNILCLLKFFYNDTFHGLFNRPFFRSRLNRYGLLLLLTAAYLGYFYLNMVQLSTLTTNAKEADQATLLLAGKMTLSSYFNVVFILGTFMFILLNATVSLNRNSLFFAKTLPFSEREVNVSQRLFKLSVALVFFELLMIIVAPALKLIPMQWGIALLVLLTLHTVFIASFWILDFLYAALLQNMSGLKRIYPGIRARFMSNRPGDLSFNQDTISNRCLGQHAAVLYSYTNTIRTSRKHLDWRSCVSPANPILLPQPSLCASELL